MIRYALKCADDHRFESWFQSAAAFDTLASRGLVACSVCASTKVTKAIMAPGVATGAPVPAEAAPERPLTSPASEQEAAIARLKREVEANADYVGTSFAAEARAIHEGDAPNRPIWGEARLPEAQALIQEGVRIAPLPFTPTRKVN